MLFPVSVLAWRLLSGVAVAGELQATGLTRGHDATVADKAEKEQSRPERNQASRALPQLLPDRQMFSWGRPADTRYLL
jgi:hypothetical protein